MDEAARERARRRRETWRGGKIELTEAERMDDEFWQSMTAEERFLTVWSLSVEAYGDPDAPAPGLRRSPSGIRER